MSEWLQLALIPGEVIEITARFGFVPESQHAQWVFEVREGTTGALLGMESVHHYDMTHWSALLGQIQRSLVKVLEEHLQPF